MSSFMTILQWTIVAAIVAAIVLNAGGVAKIIGEFGKFWVTESSVLSTSAAVDTTGYYKAAA